LLRDLLGFPKDANAQALLVWSLNYIINRLWDPGLSHGQSQPMRMCYVGDQDNEHGSQLIDDEELGNSVWYLENNWLLGMADVFAIASIVLDQPALLADYGLPSFEFGSRNQFYPGSSISYHYAKEFVNQVGMGNMYLYADYLSREGPPVERVAADKYMLWNGFLEMINVLEIVNQGEVPRNATLRLYSIAGEGQSQLSVEIPARGQRDIVLNDVQGFERDSYGVATLEYEGTEIQGRLTYYSKPSGGGSYAFAFSLPLMDPVDEAVIAPFNTYHPSFNPGEAGLRVFNWLSIVNLDPANSRQFAVRRFLEDGSLSAESEVFVPPFGRIDLDGGHGEGPNRVGLNEVIPQEEAPFISLIHRFGQGPSSYDFAFPIVAARGDSSPQWVPISSGANAVNWVEVYNLSDADALVRVRFLDNFGRELNSGGAEDVVLPRSQRHFLASAALEPGFSGAAEIISENAARVSALSMFYFLKSSLSIDAVYGSAGKAPLSGELAGSYNLFLDMFNWLRVFNTTSNMQDLRLTVSGPGGPQEHSIVLAPNSGIDLGLHEA